MSYLVKYNYLCYICLVVISVHTQEVEAMQLRYIRQHVGRDYRRQAAQQLVDKIIEQIKLNPNHRAWEYSATITDTTLLKAFESQWLGRSRDSHLYKLRQRIERGLREEGDPMLTAVRFTLQDNKLCSISVRATRPVPG